VNSGAGLPATGTRSGPVALLGALLIAAGGGLLFAGRRRTAPLT
jgi:LPXTG-motif cell wall-anchored protein